nr:pyruvate kinase [Actinomycetota bacterium]
MDDSTRRALMANADERERSLLFALEELRSHCLEAESEFSEPLSEVLPSHSVGALNLAHYVALRRHDLRDIQEELAHLGLSSLGRSEAHVLASLETVIGVLQQLIGVDHSARRLSSVEVETPSLDRNADRLLGPLAADRATRIMVTLPAEAAEFPEVAAAFMRAGMDVARINCAHDGPEDWHAMAGHVRRAASTQGRPCLIAMDLAGPKLRTGPLPLGPPVVRIKPERDLSGIVVAPARLVLRDGPAIPSPSSPSTDIPVIPPGVLSTCRVGDVIRFRDARRAKRALVVVATLSNGVLVESHKTIYLETGLLLELSPESRVTATVGGLPRREAAPRLQVGDKLTLIRDADQADTGAGGELRVPCTLPEVFMYARVGHRVWFDDGKFGGVVSECSTNDLTVQIVEAPPGGAPLRGGKGINLPDTELPIPGLSTQDEADLATAVELADVINVSFVRNAADVELVQAHLAALGASS